MALLQRIEVREQVDVERSRRNARDSAKEAGLNDTEAAEWALIASELATNLLRYATPGGALSFSTSEEPRRALVMESNDAGPGIASIPAAMRDGFSSGGGLGGGLSAIERHSDDLAIESTPDGTSIVVRKWLK